MPPLCIFAWWQSSKEESIVKSPLDRCSEYEVRGLTKTHQEWESLAFRHAKPINHGWFIQTWKLKSEDIKYLTSVFKQNKNNPLYSYVEFIGWEIATENSWTEDKPIKIMSIG